MKTGDVSLNQLWAQFVIEELVRLGVHYVCIGLGSRSTPLVVAAARHSGVETFVGHDERSLGFHALGYARATQTPAAIITTSGTAVANLYPAVVEASSDGVPMVILTADRPLELIDTGANQTIHQDRFFGTYARWYANIPCPDAAISPAMVLTAVDQAVYRSKAGNPGPVHLNCRYREPLEPSDCPWPDFTEKIQSWQNGQSPYTRYVSPKQILPKTDVQAITKLIESADRGMIIVGRLTSESQKKAVLELIHKIQWATYADISSGLRFSDLPLHLIRHYDPLLLSESFNDRAKPSVVLHIGGRTTSKRVGQFFEQNRPQRYIVAKETPNRYDPIHSVTDHLQVDIVDLCRSLSETLGSRQADIFAGFFKSQGCLIDAVIDQTIQDCDTLSEPFVARTLSEIVPESSGLFLSNSMPVRDMDLYAKMINKTILIGTNRGVSGIDGILSTATGFAAGHQKLLTVLIGDIAMLHDLNALSLLAKLMVPVVIVVINNQGGGIFDFLPIAQHPDVLEPYFVAPHELNFKGACQTFGVPYVRVADKEAFEKNYRNAVTRKKNLLIEVSTDRQDNFKLRKKIKNRILQLLQQDIH